MSGQRGLFDIDERYAALSAAGDPLQRLASVVDFEVFRPALDAALARSDRSQGGRPPYDAVAMFKVLVLQALYGFPTNRQSSSCAIGCRSCASSVSSCTSRCPTPRPFGCIASNSS